MKRLTIILILLTTWGLMGTVRAQKIHVGTIGGLNFADLNSDVFEFAEGIMQDISSITVYGIGGIVDVNLHKNLYLHIEPMYLQQGGVLETNLAPVIDEEAPVNIALSGINLTFKTSYLDIPILLKAEFGRGFRPYILVGPTIGLLISSDFTIDVLGLGLTLDIKDITENINYGMTFGSGFRIPTGRFSILLEGRYTIGMSDIYKQGSLRLGDGPVVVDDIDFTGDREVKTRSLQIMMGVSVPLN